MSKPLNLGNVVDLSLPAIQLRSLQAKIARVDALRQQQAENIGDNANIYDMALYNGLEIAMAIIMERKPTLCIMQCCATCKHPVEGICNNSSRGAGAEIVVQHGTCDNWEAR